MMAHPENEMIETITFKASKEMRKEMDRFIKNWNKDHESFVPLSLSILIRAAIQKYISDPRGAQNGN